MFKIKQEYNIRMNYKILISKKSVNNNKKLIIQATVVSFPFL